jgi:hypothetical protein
MPKRRVLLVFMVIVVVVSLLLASTLRSLSAGVPRNDEVVFADHAFVLNEERDELVVFGQSAIHLEAGSRIVGNGALVSLNGEPVRVDGAITGDLTIFGSAITLGPDSTVSGNVTLVGDQIVAEGQIGGNAVFAATAVRLAPTAVIAGQVSICRLAVSDVNDGRAVPSELSTCAPSFLPSISPTFLLFFGGLASLAFTGLSALSVTIFPRQVAQMEDAIRRRPRKLIGLGLATLALAAGITASLLIILSLLPTLGLILTPVYLILAMGLFMSVLAGGITVSSIVGDWLLQQFRWSAPPIITAFVGGLTLMLPLLLLQALSVVSVIPLIVLTALGVLALGAAVETRMGTRSAPQRHFVQG